MNNSRTAGIANDIRTRRCVIASFALSLKADTHQYPATNSTAAAARHAQRAAGDFAMRSACIGLRTKENRRGDREWVLENPREHDRRDERDCRAAQHAAERDAHEVLGEMRGSGRLSARRVWHSIASTVNAARCAIAIGRIG